MIDTAELAMVQHLADGDVEYLQAAIDQGRGEIVYPEAERLLGDRAESVIADLVSRGVLEPTDERDVTCVLSDPHETIEMSLSRYGLTAEGRDWLDAQTAARQAAADLLENRGFDVAVDATVAGESDIDHDVHLHAVDDLVGIELVVGLADDPSGSDVFDMVALADDTGTNPVLLTTNDPSESVRELADRRGVSVLRVDGGSPAEEEAVAEPEA